MRALVLRWMRVPAEPEPPLGAPGSVRTFRAGRNFYYVRLARWIFTQVGAALGIAFSVFFIAQLREGFDAVRTAAAAEPPVASAAATPAATTVTPPTEGEPAPKKKKRTRRSGEERFREIAHRLPPWSMDVIAVIELLTIVGFLAQLPFTLAAVRLDWELRWYIVTDRSLRIRAGLWSLQESTMSFANLQQVEVMQGPLQRLLGIADVRVQSAGGGGGEVKGHEHHDSLHTGVFHGVDNASEIRDLILDRLRHFRAAGLGDPDDHHAAPATESPVAATTEGGADALAAAQQVLAEARALRQALG
ncbi:MAG: PH domain-containing protein [Candidatus Didemnitutus sp.]|nr:PH domain-containing protein [Candidatus Didemnitutus sp.]